jgi:hypothetical protein
MSLADAEIDVRPLHDEGQNDRRQRRQQKIDWMMPKLQVFQPPPLGWRITLDAAIGQHGPFANYQQIAIAPKVAGLPVCLVRCDV